MIVEDMRNTGVLGVPEEWFIPWNPNDLDIDWKRDLAEIRTRASGQNGVMSVKVMANQLHNIEECLKFVVNPSSGPLFFRFHTVFANASWVWIRRTDIVGQAVSRFMAEQTGINHATDAADHFAGNLMIGGDRTTYNQDAQYNYDAILQECAAITRETTVWKEFFRAFNIKPLILIYEDVINDNEMLHLDAISAMIGNPVELTKAERTIKKLGNSRNSDFIKRFHHEARSDFLYDLAIL